MKKTIMKKISLYFEKDEKYMVVNENRKIKVKIGLLIFEMEWCGKTNLLIPLFLPFSLSGLKYSLAEFISFLNFKNILIMELCVSMT